MNGWTTPSHARVLNLVPILDGSQAVPPPSAVMVCKCVAETRLYSYMDESLAVAFATEAVVQAQGRA
ncbi:hypothetical protein VCV18_000928 [Metarhizium anisopliae]